MNGTEDYIIIACDGLWDTVSPEEATQCIVAHLKEGKGIQVKTLTNDQNSISVPLFSLDNIDSVSQKLVTLAKEKGSSDNITIIVVFLKPIENLVNITLLKLAG